MQKWLDRYGLAFAVILMIPNILYGLWGDFSALTYHNKAVELLEQVGRYGCMLFLIMPVFSRGFPSKKAEKAYALLGFGLLALYCLGWIVFWDENTLTRALVLSILPSLLFLESGLLRRDLFLSASAVLFAVCHIFISVQSV